MKRILHQSNPDINSNAAKNKQRIHCLRQKWHNEKTRIAFAFGVCVWMSLLGMEKKVMGVHITCTSNFCHGCLSPGKENRDNWRYF